MSYKHNYITMIVKVFNHITYEYIFEKIIKLYLYQSSNFSFE